MTKKAILLASGAGTRMGKLTHSRPKPLLEIQGKPILHYILKNLSSSGFKEVGINVHFHGEQIKNYLEKDYGINIYLLPEESLSGTAGAVRKFSSFLGDDPFLVHYGDILTDTSLSDFWSHFEQKKSTASILLHKNPNSNSFVKLNEQNYQITQFFERPKFKPQGSFFTNSGVYCFTKEIHPILNSIDKDVLDFPSDIFPKLIEGEQITGYILKGKRIAIDSKERWEKANREFEEFQFEGEDP